MAVAPAAACGAFVGATLPSLSSASSRRAATRRARPPPPAAAAGHRRLLASAAPSPPPPPPAQPVSATGSTTAGKGKGVGAHAPAPAPTPEGASAPGVYGGGQVPTTEGGPPPSPDPDQRPPEYYANVGKVVETLRADYPALPHRTPDLSIYSPRVAFHAKHPPGGVRMPALRGLDAYGALLWATRAHIRVLLVSPSLRVLSLYHDAGAGRLYLRWRLAGTPRYVAVARPGGEVATSGPAWMYDGMSVYQLGKDGWVVAHELDPNVWNKRKLRSVQSALAVVGGRPLARARRRGIAAGVAGYPQLWFEELGLSGGEEDEDDDGGEEAAEEVVVAADDADRLVPPRGADLSGGAAV